MIRVLILWAEPSSPNLGVRVLAEGANVLVKAAWADSQIEHWNASSAPDGTDLGGFSMLKALFGLGKLSRKLRSFDLVLDTRSGDSFTDAYGIRRHLKMTLMGMCVPDQARYIMLPQTFGPFSSILGNLTASIGARHAEVFFARDSGSLMLANARLSATVLESTDLVFALPVLPPTGRNGTIVNVSGLLWDPNPHVDYRQYRSILSAIVSAELAEGNGVTFVPHVLSSGTQDDDERVLEALFERFPEAKIEIPHDLPDARRIISEHSFLVGSRMHACLNALSQGVPAFPIGYSDKFAPLMRDIGWAHGADLRFIGPEGNLLRKVREARRDTLGATLVAADGRRRMNETLQRFKELVGA